MMSLFIQALGVFFLIAGVALYYLKSSEWQFVLFMALFLHLTALLTR